ncbi:hypothetical protein H5410_003836 [Solanum commersonii]|uniref:Uncharacterized protein n=1 Tax=Solanum commersonii TaxID=4109 RepID=A0A9J6B6S0_SOLCO|nr:hypothetical protein H5410_003836 [Solanum commersonii]
MRVPTVLVDRTNKTKREHKLRLNKYLDPSFAAFRNYPKHLVLLFAFLAVFPCISVFSHYVLESLIAANLNISTWNREDVNRKVDEFGRVGSEGGGSGLKKLNWKEKIRMCWV